MANDIELLNLANKQVSFVKSMLGKRFRFVDEPSKEGEKGYTTYGTLEKPNSIIVVRISNHNCSMQNWSSQYKPPLVANKKLLRRMGKNLQRPYKEKVFFSIVFKAFDYTTNDKGSWKAVFNPLEVQETNNISTIALDAQKLSLGTPIPIGGISPTVRTTDTSSITNPQVDKNNENKQYSNMKKLIRLTEGDLHQIVEDAVKRLIRENIVLYHFKLIAYIIDPDNEWQRGSLSDEEYRQVMSDYERSRDGDLKTFMKYKVDSDTIEEFGTQDKYHIDEDADGLYLFKRID
jgi:3D (Asp-Asp-Asp) domain-containing protein